jgi:cytochrome P450
MGVYRSDSSGPAARDRKSLYWDPFDPALRDDPYPLWRRLRDEAPVWHNQRYDFWVLSRYHDIELAQKDTRIFSSSHGTTIELMTVEPMRTGMIIAMDPPSHTQLRSLVSRAFTSRRVSSLEDRIRSICGDLLDAQAGRDSFDYVQDFGAIVPPTVISSLLGVPPEDREELRHVIDGIFHIEGDVGMINDTSIASQIKLRGYLKGAFVDRRRTPRDDMLTALLNAELPAEAGVSRRLTEEELLDFGTILFVAGTETVARLLGFIGSVLDEHPEQRAELSANPALIPAAIEELLRYEPPSPVNARWTNADYDLHGQVIPAGSKVVLLTGSAGRDERKYPDPDRFDIHRDVDQHLTFGYGLHFCLGAALARMEGRIALEETLRRYPTWTVHRDEAVFLYTSTVRGYQNLPVSVGAR